MAQLGSRFGELFPRVLGVQELSWGLGFHLASQVMFIYGLGSFSGKNLKTVWTLLKTLSFKVTRVITFHP